MNDTLLQYIQALHTENERLSGAVIKLANQVKIYKSLLRIKDKKDETI